MKGSDIRSEADTNATIEFFNNGEYLSKSRDIIEKCQWNIYLNNNLKLNTCSIEWVDNGNGEGIGLKSDEVIIKIKKLNKEELVLKMIVNFKKKKYDLVFEVTFKRS